VYLQQGKNIKVCTADKTAEATVTLTDGARLQQLRDLACQSLSLPPGLALEIRLPNKELLHCDDDVTHLRDKDALTVSFCAVCRLNGGNGRSNSNTSSMGSFSASTHGLLQLYVSSSTCSHKVCEDCLSRHLESSKKKRKALTEGGPDQLSLHVFGGLPTVPVPADYDENLNLPQRIGSIQCPVPSCPCMIT
jgi:hypothetical protein